MKLLLDTVAIYRAATAPERLPTAVQALLADPAQVVVVSLVSAWELAIKTSLGKLLLPCAVDEFFQQTTRDLQAQSLGLDLTAVARVARLPLHHGDPFDRLLIAQALAEGCAVATSNHRFVDYGVAVIW
jgi:PIN domain nuclease of toxin-antitoxin system